MNLAKSWFGLDPIVAGGFNRDVDRRERAALSSDHQGARTSRRTSPVIRFVRYGNKRDPVYALRRPALGGLDRARNV